MDMGQTFERLRSNLAEAYRRAPAIRALLDEAGMTPADIRNLEDLARIPVTKKESLVDLQRSAPPFGGFLSSDSAEIKRIFVSPGPIFEPQLRGDDDCRGCVTAFRAAGIGVGDVVLNTWAYHLVPAGLVFDDGLCATGATVIPSGTGNTEQQARLIAELSVTVVLASTAYFMTLLEKLDELGWGAARDKLRLGYLGGEFGDWMGKRRSLEERYGISTSSLYGTGELGVIAYEESGADGLRVHQDRIVQICDPLTGAPLPAGEAGEVVVTSLTPGWGLIRLGTGDITYATESTVDGLVTRLAPLQGRVGQAVKAREIFIYPQHVDAVPARVPGVVAAQVRVTRPGPRDHIELRLVAAADSQPAVLAEVAARAFREEVRLRADKITWVEAEDLARDPAKIVDERYAPVASRSASNTA